MSNWKPGDVALVRLDAETEVRATRTANDDWVAPNGTRYDPALTARPLVVLDPENREQVASLFAAIHGCSRDDVESYDITEMADVLRSLVAPPRPTEPTGLGAVVEDEQGKRYVRIGAEYAARDEARAWADDSSTGIRYTDIAAVRVLSDGVA